MQERVKCKSGLTGWQGKLRDQYESFEHFTAYAETYGLHTRLGYKTIAGAWRGNPTVRGSVIPTDYEKVK
jgi:hypothetical protein